jgi:hypothetical protein
MNTCRVRKIQLLSDRSSGHPIYYCHHEDEDHDPCLLIESDRDYVFIRARETLYKVKRNPQTKNRVDIYMSLEQAVYLGRHLVKIAHHDSDISIQNSNTNPNLNAQGNMKLPNIVWSKSIRHAGIKARSRIGSEFPLKESGYIYIDLESPHSSHIKMTEHEIHIGIDLQQPTGNVNIELAELVWVPEVELQRGTNEKNPLRRTVGDMVIRIDHTTASAMGKLLCESVNP